MRTIQGLGILGGQSWKPIRVLTAIASPTINAYAVICCGLIACVKEIKRQSSLVLNTQSWSRLTPG